MTFVETFLTELEKEAASNRRVLEQVPEGLNSWKPHPRSMELGYLASMVASMLGWIEMMIEDDSIDFAPVGGEPMRTPVQEGREALLRELDRSVAAARKALTNTTEEHLATPWRIMVGGHVIDEQPRHRMIRDGVFQHLAHHRGQLTVYLRLNDARVPAIYGPSADEGPMGEK
jgi:uncharacterized damage-inducible protein DinB